MVRQWVKDGQLGLFIVASLLLFRLLLIAIFHQQAGEMKTGAVATVLLNGLRYDLSTAAVWIAPLFLASIATALVAWESGVVRLRLLWARLYVLVAVPLFGADLIYFDEYGDQFEQHIFGLVHDDTLAILITIWKEYHPLLFGLLAIPSIAAGFWLARRWLGWTPGWAIRVGAAGGVLRGTLLVVSVVLLFAAAVRGGTLWGEPIRLKHAFVVDDLFLNRTVLNPFSALRYTLATHFALQRSGGLSTLWPGENIREALNTVRQARGEPAVSGPADLDRSLETTTKAENTVRPQHLFLILMESHSGWTVMPAYRFAGFSPEVSALADRGIYFPHFLPSSGGTVGSMNALLTGMPEAGLNINYEPNSLAPYPTGVAATFKRLGYTTRFFYGGFLSWQRLDTFARAQGFDEVYGGGNMNARMTNEWGVDDQALFDFVLKQVADEPPSFNFILTTTNHPPYDLDLEALGFPLTALPESLKTTRNDTLKVLGHLWYSDRQAGRFVREAEARLSRPLFALTGDHTARLKIRFPGDSVAEQLAVPLVIYGPEVLGRRGEIRRTAGSHIDIPPTLYGLAAPTGFRYSSFGRDLLSSPSPSYGLGYEFIIGENFIAADSERQAVYRLPDQAPADSPAPEPPADFAKIRRQFQALKALSWYRVRRGASLPE